MRRAVRLALAIRLVLVLALVLLASAAAFASANVYVSPGVRQHILPEIQWAEKSIDVAMYAFTDSDLAWALVRARERGVEVRVCLDKEPAAGKYSKSRFLAGRGLAVRLHQGGGLMHHKFAVIDGRVVVTGSYNWTASAEAKNDENALIVVDPAIAATYAAEFERLWAAAVPTAAPVALTPAKTATKTVITEAPSSEPGFWASKKSDKYHWPSCASAKRIKPDNLIVFATVGKALKAGYKPCETCRPPASCSACPPGAPQPENPSSVAEAA